MQQSEPETCRTCAEAPAEKIGRPGEPIRALALGAGGFDTVMQLGVAHALVVSDAKPPDVVVGISMGAVNAAAIAEILGPQDDSSPATQRDAQLSRFRKFLYAAQEADQIVAATVAPDMYEADAGRVLEPHHLSLHFRKERDERQEAMRSRTGLVELLNALVTLRITVGTVVRFVRCYLGWRAAGELPRGSRWRIRTIESLRAVRTLLANLLSCVEVLLLLAGAALRVSFRVEPRFRVGNTAGRIIFRFKLFRRFLRIIAVGLCAALIVGGLIASAIFFFPMVGVSIFLIVALFEVLSTGRPPRYVRLARALRDSLLARYDLLRDLASPYALKNLFVRLFDPEYHGRIDMHEVVEQAFRHTVNDPGREPASNHKPKTLAEYRQQNGIQVVPVVGDLATGRLTSIRESTEVVDGLLASIAVVPWLRPFEMDGTYYIDGANVSNEPTSALMAHLRSVIHPDVTAAYVYPVSHLPISQERMASSEEKTYTGLMQVVRRARQLQAFRHARLERKLIRLYARNIGSARGANEKFADKNSIGQPRALHCFGRRNSRDLHFVRAELFPIEPPERPISVWRRLLRARSKNEKQRILAAAIAEGCRLTLERILPETIEKEAAGAKTIGCRNVLAARRGEAVAEMPGANEICEQCALNPKAEVAERAPRMLRKVEAEGTFPEWPARGRAESTNWKSKTVTIESEKVIESKPQIGLLFSGGVFRGVFLVGVLNALDQLGVKPTIIAGSSVGSITAAMAARVFAASDDFVRRNEIVRLAATFLALDHLIVTDRFADFVRRLTLRAAETDFSLRDLDRFLRRYDIDSASRFSRTARVVIAGIEHLLYISPWELERLVRSIRLRRYRQAILLLRRYSQELLDRGDVAMEMLGTEPLRLLIAQHVLNDGTNERVPDDVPATFFRKHRLEFLATMTNLTSGELEVVNLPPKSGSPVPAEARLVESLLASSAFPGAFRPRWSWEIFDRTSTRSQYIDGGVMDNLPLNPIVDYLIRTPGIPRRTATGIPHLLFTASLESDIEPLDPRPEQDETAERIRRKLKRTATRWPEALKRAKQMQYNKKVDTFATVQSDMRAIYDQEAETGTGGPIELDALNLSVLVVKPKWLCDTFAFHPMLGFERKKQAASIAHGCASTFARFLQASTEDDRAPLWMGPDGWNVRTDLLDDFRKSGAFTGDTIVPTPRTDGDCHFSKNIACPFATAMGIESEDAELMAVALGYGDRSAHRPLTTAALREIYDACGRRETHQPIP